MHTLNVCEYLINPFTVTIIGTCIFIYIVIYLMRWNLYIKYFNKKCIFITGCDSGFGLDLAKRLDKLGCTVFAGCYTSKGEKYLREVCTVQMHPIQLDVTSHRSIEYAKDFVVRRLGQNQELWGLVNNAGVLGNLSPCEFHSRLEFLRVFQVNFFGQVDVVNTFLPLIKQSRGRIVNCSSIAAHAPLITSGFCSPYSASKAAVHAFSTCLRFEKRMWGISVSTVLPGGHKTAMLDPAAFMTHARRQWMDLPREVKEQYGEDYVSRSIELFQLISPLTPVGNSDVVDAYEHALFARFPYMEYSTGIDSKFFLLVQRLPGFMKDFVWDCIHCYVPKPLVLQNGDITDKTVTSNGYHSSSHMNGASGQHTQPTSAERLANRSGVRVLYALAGVARFMGGVFGQGEEEMNVKKE